MDISARYDRAFFEKHLPWRAEYDLIADTIDRFVDFSSVLDLGCGNGFLIARFAERGKSVVGVDGSAHAVDSAPEHVAEKIRTMDLTRPLSIGRFDLVICTEVAEHLEERYATTLVETIGANASGTVFFTAATPGQGGKHHVNEQPHRYWIDKFAQQRFELDRSATVRVRRALARKIRTVWWFTRNALILRKL